MCKRPSLRPFRTHAFLCLIVASQIIASAASLAQPSRPTRAPLKETPPTDINAKFSSAQKLFTSGKFLEAMNAFARILQQNPNHTPSQVYYAKSLYRMDRIPESYQYFSRLDVGSLDIVTSYEFALSYFWMRQYSGAFVGFTRVPKGHALSDLANYYGGISAMKIRRYADAEAMMERAVVLPSKLARSRKLYLKHIGELKFAQEKEALAKETRMEKERLAQPKPSPSAQPTKEVTAPKSATSPIAQSAALGPAPYVHAGFQELTRIATIEAIYKTQTQDLHGYAQSTAKIQLTNFTFENGFIVPLPIGDQNSLKRSVFAMQVQLKAENQVNDGEGERRNIQTDDDDDVIRIVTTDPTRETTKYGSFFAEPWMEFSLTNDFWLGLGGRFSLKYPDFERQDRTGTRTGYGQIGIKPETFSLLLKYKYMELVNNKDELVQEENDVILTLNWPFAAFFNLESILTHAVFKYDDESVDGPTSTTDLSFDVARELPFGFTFGLYGAGQYVSQHLLRNLPNYEEVNADGQVYTGKVYLDVAPFTWFTASVSWESQHSKWDVTPDEAQKTYEQNQVENLDTFETSASINLLF